MKATVEQAAYKAGRDGDDQLELLLSQQRSALNARYSGGPFALTTAATAAWTTAWTSDDMPASSAWEVDALVLGLGDTGDAARYRLAALFTRAGTAAPVQVGATDFVSTMESAAGFDARFVVVGNGVALQLNDGGVATMRWSVHVMGRRVP